MTTAAVQHSAVFYLSQAAQNSSALLAQYGFSPILAAFFNLRSTSLVVLGANDVDQDKTSLAQ